MVLAARVFIPPGADGVSKFWKYTLVAVVVGVCAGWALYLFSGNVIVILFVKAVFKVVEIIIGLVHLNGH